MTCAHTSLHSLRELWIHTGTACNLECPFCLEGSKPGDSRLERIALGELRPVMDEAVALGVERFCFTGGEPLIVKDIVKILSYALQHRPCLVLTNGTAPLIKRVHQLQTLKQQPQALEFQVSIDHPDEQRHDADRGWGNFKRAIEGVKLLLSTGFSVSIARHANPKDDDAQIAGQYRELLRKHSLPDSLQVIALPDFGRPAMAPSDAANEIVKDEELAISGATPMCTYTRMIAKRCGSLRVWACPLTDDDARFELDASLPDAMQRSVLLQHRRCSLCVGSHAGYASKLPASRG